MHRWTWCVCNCELNRSLITSSTGKWCGQLPPACQTVLTRWAMIGVDMSCGVGQATTQHHFVEMYTSLCVHFNDWCSEHLKAGQPRSRAAVFWGNLLAISISAFLAKQMESVEIWDHQYHQFTRLVSKDLSRSSSSWRSKSLCSTRHIPEKVGKFKPVLLQQCQDSVLWSHYNWSKQSSQFQQVPGFTLRFTLAFCQESFEANLKDPPKAGYILWFEPWWASGCAVWFVGNGCKSK